MIERLKDYPYPHGDDWKEYAMSLYAALTDESRDRNRDFAVYLPYIDEDDMVSDSEDHVPTQQSVKKYVDDQIDTVDTFIEHSDTPANYTSDAAKFLVVDSTPDAVEFSSKLKEIANGVQVTGATDAVRITHDNSNASIDWNDGDLYLTTDEGTDTNSIVNVSGKGTGYGIFSALDEDNAEWVRMWASGGTGFLRVSGATPGELRIGDAANYASFEQDGEINLAGTARVTNCDWIAAGSMRAPGTKPATFVSTGIKGAWEFANAGENNEEMVSGTWKIPCSMDMSVVPVFYIGWSAPGASPGNCVWQFEYLWVTANDDTTAAAQETLTPAATAASATANGLTLTGVTGIDLPGATDKAMFWRVTRKSFSGSDTIAAVVHMHGNYMEYTMNRLGAPI